MSNLGRSIILLMIFPSSAVYSSPSSAQPGKGQPQTPAPTSRTRMDGKFGHYLVSPNGSIDGIVMEDGTVARFPLFEPVLQTAFLRPGDMVHVEGDGLSGPTGPVLINVSVEVRSGTLVRSEVTPAQFETSKDSNPRSHHGREHGLSAGKGQTANALRPKAAKGKTPGLSADSRVTGSLFFGNTGVSARRARPESFWLKLSRITTGTGHVDDDSQWSRSHETSGP